MSEIDEPVVVVIPGDLHLTEPGLENFRVARRVVDEVNTLVRPDFVQFIGDNVQDATIAQFQLFDELRNELEVPHFSIIGDHDVKDDPQAESYRKFVGPAYGVLRRKGYCFLRLHTQESRPVGISADQIEWFRREVDHAIGRNEKVMIFQHNYPYQIWEDYDGPGIDDWRAIVQTRRVEAILCGHTHYWQISNDGRNLVVATRSIGDPEGGPPGYTLLYLRGHDLALLYRSVEDRGPIVLITHPRERLLATNPAHIVSGPDRVVARVWSGSTVAACRYRMEDGIWRDLKPEGDGHWSGPIPAAPPAKGEHDLEVVAETTDGLIGSQQIRFMVDPSRRFTAVPESRPLVTSTSYC